MEKYEQLILQFNELVDKINAYEVLIEKQQKLSMEKLTIMNNLFEEQKKNFEELRNSTSFYESIFIEKYENIVDILSNKLINMIVQMTDKKLLEVQDVAFPVTEAFIETNSTLQNIKDAIEVLDKKLEKIGILDEKMPMILDQLSKTITTSKHALNETMQENDKEYDLGALSYEKSINKFTTKDKNDSSKNSILYQDNLDKMKDECKAKVVKYSQKTVLSNNGYNKLNNAIISIFKRIDQAMDLDNLERIHNEGIDQLTKIILEEGI
ncbi:MAG: hypothetical protein KJ971_00050 [Firmicutes bacterium]|nr:hypothetical protein [Bacillota bacterium]